MMIHGDEIEVIKSGDNRWGWMAL